MFLIDVVMAKKCLTTGTDFITLYDWKQKACKATLIKGLILLFSLFAIVRGLSEDLFRVGNIMTYWFTGQEFDVIIEPHTDPLLSFKGPFLYIQDWFVTIIGLVILQIYKEFSKLSYGCEIEPTSDVLSDYTLD